MKKSLTKYNYQPLFYQYSKQGSMWGQESFYYQLSARGFVNSHSITDGEANMANTALTVSGSTGFLTNNLQYSKDYYYKVDVSSEKIELNVGEKIASQRSLIKLVGKTKLSVGVVQLDGPELVSNGGSYTLNTEGTVTVVYYAERYVSGSTSYRIYSEPVTLTFGHFEHSFTKTEYDRTHHFSVCDACGEADESSKTEHAFGEWEINGDTATRVCECGYSEISVRTDPPSKGCASFNILGAFVALISLAGAVIFKKK